MKNVKAITIPEGQVKKITDSNGNVIWGNPSDFPYRRLEYIHFNGAEYVQTDFYPGTYNKNYQFEFTVDNKTDSMSLGCYYNVSTADALRRWYILNINSSGIRCGVGNQWSGYTAANSWSTTDVLKVNASYRRDNSTPKLFWFLKNMTTNTDINSANPVSATTTGNIQTSVKLRIGCRTSTTSGGTENQEYFKGKMFWFSKRNESSSGTLERNLIPCQRKSDSVCGFYDTVSNSFWPMVGTTITDAAAGPVVDEYWDLTA